MKKFRIVRGGTNPYTKKPYGVGVTVKGPTVKDAIRQEAKDTAKQFGNETMGWVFGNLKPDPVIAVFELVPVPESDWK